MFIKGGVYLGLIYQKKLVVIQYDENDRQKMTTYQLHQRFSRFFLIRDFIQSFKNIQHEPDVPVNKALNHNISWNVFKLSWNLVFKLS